MLPALSLTLLIWKMGTISHSHVGISVFESSLLKEGMQLAVWTSFSRTCSSCRGYVKMDRARDYQFAGP